MRVVNGALATATTLGVLAAGMYVINFSMRSFAARRLAKDPGNLNAGAILLGF